MKILQFNTDKDKLEVEIRKEMISRIIDGENLEVGTKVLAEYFGGKFCAKIGKVSEVVEKGSTFVMPSSMWPMNVSMSPNAELSQHIADFSSQYSKLN